MSEKLDRELAEAAGIDGDDAGAEEQAPSSTPGVVRPAPTDARPSKRSSMGLLVALLVMVGGVLALFFFGLDNAAIYSKPIDEIVTARAQWAGKKVRLEGDLVPGSLVKRDQPCEFRFTAKGATETLPIRYASCTLPDTFRDVPEGGVQVTVEGAMTNEGYFQATFVLAKCTSKYDNKTHQMKDAPAGGVVADPASTIVR
jgi:cytochrome c-type biogenesis protein CcmE